MFKHVFKLNSPNQATMQRQMAYFTFTESVHSVMPAKHEMVNEITMTLAPGHMEVPVRLPWLPMFWIIDNVSFFHLVRSVASRSPGYLRALNTWTQCERCASMVPLVSLGLLPGVFIHCCCCCSGFLRWHVDQGEQAEVASSAHRLPPLMLMEVIVVMVVDPLLLVDLSVMMEKGILAVFFSTLVQLVLLPLFTIALLHLLFIIIIGVSIARGTYTHSSPCSCLVLPKRFSATLRYFHWGELVQTADGRGLVVPGSCHFNDPNNGQTQLVWIRFEVIVKPEQSKTQTSFLLRN